MKRVITLWLVVMLLLTSCGQDGAGDAGTEEETTVQTEAVTDETKLMPNLPDTKYDGAEFRFFHYDNSTNNFDIIAEELTGEALNDAIYQRNLDTEEKFDIQLNIHLATGDLNGDTAISTITAGDDAYESLVFYGAQFSNIVGRGLVHDLSAMPHIDLSMPWWNQNFIENTTLNGKLYSLQGDISHILLEDLKFLVFNRDTFEQIGLTPPYEDVRNGTWTFDMFQTMVEGYTADTNGDGTINEDDQFGYLGHEWIMPMAFLVTNDVKICLNKDGLPQLDLNIEKITSVWEGYMNLVEGSGYLPAMSVTDSIGMDMFMENRILFMDSTMRSIRFSLRDMDADFGVAPFPKFDESMDGYRCSVGGGANHFMVPITTTRTDMVSSVLEYMAYYGYETITPVYYDEVLGQKLMRDQDSRDMLAVLRESLTFDFGENTSTGLMLGHELLYNKKNPATYLASNQTKLETELHKLLVSIGAVEE